MANLTQVSWKRLKKAARCPKGVERERETWAIWTWKHDEMKVVLHADSGWSRRAREEVDRRRYDDDQQRSVETLVKNTSDACGVHGGS